MSVPVERTAANGSQLLLSVCPVCSHPLDCASVPCGEPVRPKPGDVSICISCGEILVFGPDLKLREVDLNHLVSLDAVQHNLLERAQRYIRERGRIGK